MADLRAVLADVPMGREFDSDTPDRILAALHAADEPLVSEVDVPSWLSVDRPATRDTVRGVWLTEDVLRERLRSEFQLPEDGMSFTLHGDEVDSIVRALLGEAS